ncbi:Rhs element Vgr protein, partial [Pseudomonas syringae pv. actinidiae ICMP 18883]
SGAQGAQIDASEAQQQLKNSEQRVKTLSDTAQQHNALPMQEGLDSLTQLNKHRLGNPQRRTRQDAGLPAAAADRLLPRRHRHRDPKKHPPAQRQAPDVKHR